jgi:O-antigen biosynthesis protein
VRKIAKPFRTIRRYFRGESGAVSVSQLLKSSRSVGVFLKETGFWDTIRGKRKAFDRRGEKRFVAELERTYQANSSFFDEIAFSVIMPVYNRADMLERAIQSVLDQSHRNFELIIVDDGSVDGSRALAEKYEDKRIRLIHREHQGVSAARNTGLKEARSDFVAYLDADNIWTSQFLRRMAVFMSSRDLVCGYAAAELRNDWGMVSGYRCDRFDWDRCLEKNFIDLNTFCHRRSTFLERGGFDEALRRMVDWDLILRFTKGTSVGYAAFIGCVYSNFKHRKGRISIEEPRAFREVVRIKNQNGLFWPEQRIEIARLLRLRFAIKIAAPYEERQEWGDFHFAESLKEALERLGHKVVIDFRKSWCDRRHPRDDVVIVLRGLTPYVPRTGPINILWNISHPDQVPYEEYDAYDIIYVASLSYRGFLANVISKPVATLLQATDARRFQPAPAGGTCTAMANEILFVGNSRKKYRPIVRWALESGFRPSIYGTRWSDFVPQDLIKGENIDNKALARAYASAKVVLNDHWESMREHGFISNRIFDVLASGARLISDAMPSIDHVFGDAVTQVRGPEELRGALSAALSAGAPDDDRERIASRVRAHHSLDARAVTMINDISAYLGLPHPFPEAASQNVTPIAPPTIARRKPLRVGAIVRWEKNHPQSSSYIRLCAPLTSEAVSGEADFSLLRASEVEAATNLDICIVQRTAIDDRCLAESLVDGLRSKGRRLIVDNDDAFALIDETHPEYELYRSKNAVLEHLLAAADQAWFSTDALAEVYRPVCQAAVVVPNALDPRVWRNYRAKHPPFGTGRTVRMVYMGTATHDADFALILPALDRLAAEMPGRFDLSLIGAVRRAPKRRWLRRMPPPAAATAYPRFVRWLTREGPFDLGLSPLVDNPFNSCKSDLKFLDYCGLGVLSILSDVRAYSGDAKALGLAVLATNTADGWYEVLRRVLRDPCAFAPQIAAAQEYLWTKRNVSGIAEQQLELLRNVADARPLSPDPDHPDPIAAANPGHAV